MPDRNAPEDPEPGALKLRVTPAAVRPLAEAVRARGEGAVVRLFVEHGVHPRVGMLVDRPNPSDLSVDVEGIRIVVDAPSLKFLQDASIDYLVEPGSTGFRVLGPNLPGAAPETAPGAAPAAPAPRDRAGREELLRKGLKQVFDPEIPMNILDLGLIYGIEWPADDRVAIRMTMTSPGCPVADLLVDEVRKVALAVPGIQGADVEVVWDPPWGPDRMSEFARRQFGYA